MSIVNRLTRYHFIALILMCAPYAAATNFNLDDNGIAIHGYDPVAYFDHQPRMGKSDLSSTYNGATFYFSSQQNLEVFQSNPEMYVPQFGGYCSYGVRMGKKLDIDPEAYAIRNDRLYLLLNRATRKVWRKDPDRNIEIARRLWPSLRPIPAAQLNRPE